MAFANVQSFADMILRRVEDTPDRTAFMYPTDPGWGTMTWRQVGDRVRAMASGLRALGLKNEERCSLLASTSLDWILCDYAVMCAAGATTTIYPSNTPDECAYIINDSASQIAFVENELQLEKLQRKRGEVPGLKHVVLMTGAAPAGDGWVLTVDQLAEKGMAYDRADPGRYADVIRGITPQRLATLLYTSGTTGRPKGVELVHDCWIYEAEGIDELKMLLPEDLQLLWLPLSHSFGKVLLSAHVYIGHVMAVDGRIEKLVDNLAEVKPTWVAAVPRVFEKVHNKVVMGAHEHGGAKAKIFDWAMGVGAEASKLVQAGKKPSGVLALKRAIAHKLVFQKLHDRFGGHLKCFISGSAPLSLEVAEFFHAAGVIILEGYGLTETSAATFVNRIDRYKLGTVGPPLPGTEVKIAPEDGEVLIRGRGVMRGYHKLPDATAETLMRDGWLRTGDIGEVDANGFLKITDRKKDLIKTSGGKYVAPQALESKLKASCPYIANVVVHGNNRNFCSALITLDEESLRNWARGQGLGDGASLKDLTEHPRVKTLIQGYFDEVNSGLASYETIKRFAILPQDLTVEAGDLTASLKVKRKAVEQKYKHLLDGFYTEAAQSGL